MVSKCFLSFSLIVTLIVCNKTQAQTSPVEWGDLHWGNRFFLMQELGFTSDIVVSKNSEFIFLFEVGLPEIRSILIEMQAPVCFAPSQSSEGQLFNPIQATPGRDRRVWVELKQDCILDIYVEAIDYYSNSFFGAYNY
ncbi:MAG: hypothetical protein IPK04_17530 [Bdellovibrionales bacterium]|nr:hypothetical protein [Bdellovibrionales bacterium]